MDKSTCTCIALPHLHEALAWDSKDIQGLLTECPQLAGQVFCLWPGLPQPPAGYWLPEFPWSSGQASAYIHEMQTSARFGAEGSPVQAYAVQSAFPDSHDLTYEEQHALQAFQQGQQVLTHPHSMELPEAQQALLLVWLREEQTLELQALETEVVKKQVQLNSLLADPLNQEDSGQQVTNSASDRESLPHWGVTLGAAWNFLPLSSCKDILASPLASAAMVLLTNQDMAKTVHTRGERLTTLCSPMLGAVRLSRHAASLLTGKKLKGPDEIVCFFPASWVDTPLFLTRFDNDIYN